METKETNRQRPLLRGLCILAVLAIVVAVTAWCLQVRDDRDAAVASFNAACLALHDQNIALDKAMADLEDAIDVTAQLFPTVNYDDILQEMTRCQTALEACIAQEEQGSVASASVF